MGVRPVATAVTHQFMILHAQLMELCIWCYTSLAEVLALFPSHHPPFNRCSFHNTLPYVLCVSMYDGGGIV